MKSTRSAPQILPRDPGLNLLNAPFMAAFASDRAYRGGSEDAKQRAAISNGQTVGQGVAADGSQRTGQASDTGGNQGTGQGNGIGPKHAPRQRYWRRWSEHGSRQRHWRRRPDHGARHWHWRRLARVWDKAMASAWVRSWVGDSESTPDGWVAIMEMVAVVTKTIAPPVCQVTGSVCAKLKIFLLATKPVAKRCTSNLNLPLHIPSPKNRIRDCARDSLHPIGGTQADPITLATTAIDLGCTG